MASTYEFLVNVLRDRMNLPVPDADDTALGSGGLDLESLGITELVMHCEEGLGVRIPDDEYQQISHMTVRRLADHLDARLRGGS